MEVEPQIKSIGISSSICSEWVALIQFPIDRKLRRNSGRSRLKINTPLRFIQPIVIVVAVDGGWVGVVLCCADSRYTNQYFVSFTDNIIVIICKRII